VIVRNSASWPELVFAKSAWTSTVLRGFDSTRSTDGKARFDQSNNAPVTMARARPIRSLLLRNFCAIVAIAALLSYGDRLRVAARRGPDSIGRYSYYVYLPSWWIYHDVTLDSVARDCLRRRVP